MLGTLAFLAVLAVFGGFLYRHFARIRWVHEQAIPEIQRLVAERKGGAAYRLIRQAEHYAPNDDALKKVKTAVLWPAPIRTTPPGADVYFRDYNEPHAPWDYLGKTPLEQNRLPQSFYAYKFIKTGYEPVEASSETERWAEGDIVTVSSHSNGFSIPSEVCRRAWCMLLQAALILREIPM
jgi:hypothetical protein